MKAYDIIHFEALGAEANYLEEETKVAQAKGLLPESLSYVITPENLQNYLKANPDVQLPDIITTKTHSVLPDEYINSGNKKSVITRSAGYDHFEHLAEQVNIASLRIYCVNAVAQTAIKLAYCAAGQYNKFLTNTATFDRKSAPTFMEFNENRIATVFGLGHIGKRAYELCVGNGLTTWGVDVREDELKALYGDSVKFVTKEEALEHSNIIINCMNLTRDKDSKLYNLGYFSKDVLSQTKKGLVFVNVTRGEIAPESGLLELFESGHISGIGLDVFTGEAGFANYLKTGETDNKDHIAGKVLLDKALGLTSNIYVQPHQAYNSDAAALSKAHEAIEHLIAWYKNGGNGFDEQLPYYNMYVHTTVA